jgi:hypothetical protein
MGEPATRPSDRRNRKKRVQVEWVRAMVAGEEISARRAKRPSQRRHGHLVEFDRCDCGVERVDEEFCNSLDVSSVGVDRVW